MKSLNFLALTLAITCYSVEAAPVRPIVPGQSVLSINGKFEQVLTAKNGGTLVGKVIEVRRPDGQVFKEIGQLENEELSMEMPVTEGLDVFDWINLVSVNRQETRNLSVTNCDQNLNITSARDYNQSIPTEFSLSNMDATKAEAGKVFLKVKPGQVLENTTSGKCQIATKSKTRWLSSNFKVEINGVDLRAVRSVENLKLQIKLSEQTSGSGRLPRSALISQISLSNFRLTASTSDRKELEKWFNSFVIQGQNSDQDEKTASIILLDQTMRTEIGRIRLFNVGIFRLSDDFEQAGGREVSFLTADLYAERVEFDFK
jgi:hypothetical protein